MCDRKARWAIWSLGNIANRVIVEMKEADDYEIAAICSSNLEKASEFIKNNNLTQAKAYDNIQNVLKRDDVDIVYIASPPWLHVEQCCQVMNAGKGVLCEKPMTLNYRDAVQIAECARKNKVFCAEGIWSNYFPAVKKLKEWIETGKIGSVVEIITTFGFPLSELVRVSDMSRWGNKMSSGGGALAQFGCYNVNLSQYVYGKLPEEIAGKSYMLSHADGADLSTTFIMSYNGGAQHTMVSCSREARTMSDSRISGTKGEIVIGRPFFAPFRAELYTHKDHFWYNDLDEVYEDLYMETGREGFKYQFDAVSKYVIEGKTESEEVPIQYSLDLAYTMERVRENLEMIVK